MFSQLILTRSDKVIRTSGGHQVPYDYLVLCCGQQFQIAVPNGADINTLVTTAEVPRPRELVYRGKLPGNVFTINSHRDVQDTLRWIETSFARNEGTVGVLKYFFQPGMFANGVEKKNR